MLAVILHFRDYGFFMVRVEYLFIEFWGQKTKINPY